MRFVLCLIPLVVVVCAGEYNHILSDEFINEINSKQSLWKAGRNFDPDTPRSKIRCLLGLKMDTKRDNLETIHHEVNEDDIPESFDARENWDKCQSIKTIADQSACGSCWAVAASSAMSDRACIATDGAFQPSISAANLMSCCEECGNGCGGGTITGPWTFWVSTGVVTGGGYNTTEGCQNYPFPSCEHHTTGSKPACPSDLYVTPECKKSCDAGWNTSYEDSLTFGENAYYINNGEKHIQSEIMKNGPVSTGFAVYSDFLSYKSGVYKQTSGQPLGGHAVRIIGWGVENGVKYWLITNSWNSDWGDKGLFKMIRGENDCGIENLVTFGPLKITL